MFAEYNEQDDYMPTDADYDLTASLVEQGLAQNQVVDQLKLEGIPGTVAWALVTEVVALRREYNEEALESEARVKAGIYFVFACIGYAALKFFLYVIKSGFPGQ